MHRDQKIGLAFAVLVLGFAGAFSFRNEPLIDPQPLALHETAELDARIEQLPVRAYTQQEGVRASTYRQTGETQDGASTQRSLADQVIRFGVPGSEKVLADGELIDLFPGPPEPVVVDAPTEPSVLVGTETDRLPPTELETGPVLPEEIAASAEEPAVLPTGAEAAAPALHVVEPAPLQANYIVKSGDTLSDIALSIYGDSRRYLDLYRANRDVLSDPDDLPVGTTLRIP